MIIDTSALIAILRDEPEAAACTEAIEAAPHRRISAANLSKPQSSLTEPGPGRQPPL